MLPDSSVAYSEGLFAKVQLPEVPSHMLLIEQLSYSRGGGEGGGNGGGNGGGDGGGGGRGLGGGGLGGDGGGAGGGEGGGGQLPVLVQLAGGGGDGGHIEISSKLCHEPVDSKIPSTQFEHRYDQNGFTEHGTLMANSALLSSISKLEKLDAVN